MLTVKLRLTTVSDAQHGGFTTDSRAVSWGSIDSLCVNLTVPPRVHTVSCLEQPSEELQRDQQHKWREVEAAHLWQHAANGAKGRLSQPVQHDRDDAREELPGDEAGDRQRDEPGAPFTDQGTTQGWILWHRRS